jgi:hypothetical protein
MLTDLRTGLDMARGVGTPIAFIRCCIVGLGPGPLGAGDWTCCCCCWSGDNGSGVWLRDWDTSIPLFQYITTIKVIFHHVSFSHGTYCMYPWQNFFLEHIYTNKWYCLSDCIIWYIHQTDLHRLINTFLTSFYIPCQLLQIKQKSQHYKVRSLWQINF